MKGLFVHISIESMQSKVIMYHLVINIRDIDRLLAQQRISAFLQHQRIMEMMVTYNYKDDRIL